MTSFFATVATLPPNSVFGISTQCKNDEFEDKIDLCVGAYRDDNGQTVVLPSVRKAETILYEAGLDHEYLPQDGLAAFNRCAQHLLFGEDTSLISTGRLYSIQCLSGTGSLRLAVDFFVQNFPGRRIYLPAQTWLNHGAMLVAAHAPNATYRYLDSSLCGLDFDGMLADIQAVEEGSIILLHSCAHNPSGCDPTDDQWRQLLVVMKARGLFPFFDNAYQGFVSGDPAVDAFAVRLFVEAGMEMVVACSFAKNFGLYGERVGCLHVVSDSACIAAIGSQMRAISRTMYSNCPSFGARLVSIVLGNPELKAEWLEQCRGMAERLSAVRRLLHSTLNRFNVKGSWDHIIKQRGMFSYTGIPRAEVLRLKTEFHVYMLEDGRISLAGLNNRNIERFVTCIAAVLGRNDDL